MQEDLRGSVRRARAIDFKQKERWKNRSWDHYPGHRFKSLCRPQSLLRLRRYPNVYTSLEVERLIKRFGADGGELILRTASGRRRRDHPLRRVARC